jgi:hypothetical protein
VVHRYRILPGHRRMADIATCRATKNYLRYPLLRFA